jgi:hypothetical protein
MIKSVAIDASDNARIQVDVDTLRALEDKYGAVWGNLDFTKTSYQTNDSFLRYLRVFQDFLEQEGIQGTAEKRIFLLSDGAKTRFSLAALRFMDDHHIVLYLFPPHATMLYQPLDKLYQDWHSAYKIQLDRWCERIRKSRKLKYRPMPNRSDMLEMILQAILEGWHSVAALCRAWEACGFTSEGFDVHQISEDDLLPEVGTVDELTKAFLLGTPPEVCSPRVPGLETEMQYQTRRADFYEGKYMERCSKPVTLRELGVLQMPGEAEQDGDVERKGKTVSIWGAGSSKRMRAKAEEAYAVEMKKAGNNKKKAKEVLPTRWLMLLTGWHADPTSDPLKTRVEEFYSANHRVLPPLPGKASSTKKVPPNPPPAPPPLRSGPFANFSNLRAAGGAPCKGGRLGRWEAGARHSRHRLRRAHSRGSCEGPEADRRRACATLEQLLQ